MATAAFLLIPAENFLDASQPGIRFPSGISNLGAKLLPAVHKQNDTKFLCPEE